MFNDNNDYFQSISCGLTFHLNEIRVPVPLRAVSIKTKVVEFVAEVTIEQKYVNRESNPIETVYMFPVEEEATVINFTAEIDGRIIETEVRNKEEARQTYYEAVAMRKTAVVMEETTPEIFRIKLGQLKPGAEAKLTVVYISELPAEETAARLTIPTTVSPRYVPPTDNSEAAKFLSAIPYSMNSPAPLSFDLEVLSQHKIISIKSPSHYLKTETCSGENENGQFYAKASIAGKTSDLNRDIVVLIENSSPHEPMVFIEKSEDPMLAGMVSLVPSFKLKEQSVELIFLVDRSGSMRGTSIEQAKKALELFLHSLPTDCYFNIFSFGSAFDSLFKKSEKYDDHTLFAAKKYVSEMSANYGGTEIYEPFQAIFAESPIPRHLRQIFMLTDGEVSNAENVIDLVKRNSEYGRVFALGLGTSTSRYLVKGIARAAGGTAVFAALGEDLRPKVMTQLKRALQPSVSEVEIIWNGIFVNKVKEAEQPEIETQKTLLGYMKPKRSLCAKKLPHLDGQSPLKIPPIYDGSRLLAYHLFSENETNTPKSVTINAKTPDGPLSVELPIGKSCLIGGNFVHQLAARKRIQDITESLFRDDAVTNEEIKNAIIKLGIKYKLASNYTSFVGVDKKEPNACFELEMITREINNEIPFGSYFKSNFVSGANTLSGYGDLNYGACLPPSCCAVKTTVQGALGKKKTKSFGCILTASLRNAFSSSKLKSKSKPLLAIDSNKLVKAPKNSMGLSHENKKLLDFEAITAKVEDQLSSIIGLQSADGHFHWGDVFLSSLGKSQSDIESACPNYANKKLWITALAIVLLEKLVNRKDLWELVVLKAKKFISKQMINTANEENLMNAAKYFVE